MWGSAEGEGESPSILPSAAAGEWSWVPWDWPKTTSPRIIKTPVRCSWPEERHLVPNLSCHYWGTNCNPEANLIISNF